MKLFGTKKIESSYEHKSDKRTDFQEKINEVEEISPQQFKKIANETLAELHHHSHSHHSKSTHHHISPKKKVEEDLSIDDDFDVDKFLADYQNKHLSSSLHR